MPSLEIEHAVYETHGCRIVAGLDEAGRGALAGPVVAAAVVLPLDDPALSETLAPVDDSKQLTADVREELFALVAAQALAYGIGAATADTIDDIGIIPATKLAMWRALAQLTLSPEFLLIDGRIQLTHPPLPQQSVIRGDSLSLSIAAASILAKVSRDRHMIELDKEFPSYGFARHKGYGTQFHRDAIAQHGPCAHHRHTFAPIRQSLP